MRMRPALYTAFLSRFPREQYAVMEEVCEDVSGSGRRADVMVLNLWRSRGQELQGFEVKSDRGDWLREKADPAKAEVLARFCDRWWVVTTAPDVVKKDELPPTWGLLELHGKRLVQVAPAPKLVPADRPWAFVCSLVRRAQDEARRADKSLVEELREEVRAQLTAEAGAPETVKNVARLERELDEARRLISDFNEKAGVHLAGWSLGNIAAASKLIQSIEEHGLAVTTLERIHAQLENAERSTAEALKAAVEEIRKRRGAA